jgi:hypothetical protein
MFKYLKGTTPTGTGCMFLASVGAFLFGFDNGWWGTILGSQRFLSDYGSCVDIEGVRTCNLSTAQLSAGSSVQSGGISKSIESLIPSKSLTRFVSDRMSDRHVSQ